MLFAALGKVGVEELGLSATRAETDGQTDGQTDATKHIISLVSRSIKSWFHTANFNHDGSWIHRLKKNIYGPKNNHDNTLSEEIAQSTVYHHLRQICVYHHFTIVHKVIDVR